MESTQKGSLDVSQWLVWYFERLTEALEARDETLSKVLVKARFWEIHKTTQLNEPTEQITLLKPSKFKAEESTR